MPRLLSRDPGRPVMLLRGLGLVAGVALLAGGVAAVRAVPRLLGHLPMFEVATVRVTGTTLIDDRAILALAAIPDTASVFQDPTDWEEAVAAHPVVRRARVRRDLPSTLVIEVEEREAVAFVATPVLEPVDRDGRILPVDPSRVRMDLPVVRLRPSAGDDGSPPPPHRLRRSVEALARLRENPAFHTRLSGLREEADGSVTAFWGSSPGLEVRMNLPVDPGRVDEALDVLSLALARDTTATPRYLDLRFAEQVVVGYGPE